MLLLDDPWTRRPYLSLYKRKCRDGDWKKAASFKIHSAKHLAAIVETLREFRPHPGD